MNGNFLWLQAASHIPQSIWAIIYTTAGVLSASDWVLYPGILRQFLEDMNFFFWWLTLTWRLSFALSEPSFLTQSSRTCTEVFLSSLFLTCGQTYLELNVASNLFPSSFPTHRHNKILAPFISSCSQLLEIPGLMQKIYIRAQRPGGTDGRWVSIALLFATEDVDCGIRNMYFGLCLVSWWSQSESKTENWGANGVTPGLCPKVWEPEVPIFKSKRRWMPQLKEKKFTFPLPFCSVQRPSIPTCIGKGNLLYSIYCIKC